MPPPVNGTAVFLSFFVQQVRGFAKLICRYRMIGRHAVVAGVGPHPRGARRARHQRVGHLLHPPHGALQAQRPDCSAVQGFLAGVQVR